MSSIIEAGRQELARLGFAAPKPETTRYPTALLDDGNVMFYGYKCFDSFAHLVTDVRGRVVEVYAGEPPLVIDDNWEAELTGEIACQEFLRYAAEWDSAASRNERHHAIHQGISEFIREQVKRDSSLEAWALSTDPHLNECTVNDISSLPSLRPATEIISRTRRPRHTIYTTVIVSSYHRSSLKIRAIE